MSKGIEYTPIPPDSPPGTTVHPAFQDACIFSVLVGALIEYSHLVRHTETNIALMDMLDSIQSRNITTVAEIRKQVLHHSKFGKFQSFKESNLGMALVASEEVADQGKSGKPYFSFRSTGSCQYGDQCWYLHSDDKDKAPLKPDVKTARKVELKNDSPILSTVDNVKIQMYFDKTEEIQAYLNGAARKLGHSYKVGKNLRLC